MDYGFGRCPVVASHKSETCLPIADAVLGLALAIDLASVAE
jgi:hypothetical protein